MTCSMSGSVNDGFLRGYRWDTEQVLDPNSIPRTSRGSREGGSCGRQYPFPPPYPKAFSSRPWRTLSAISRRIKDGHIATLSVPGGAVVDRLLAHSRFAAGHRERD